MPTSIPAHERSGKDDQAQPATVAPDSPASPAPRLRSRRRSPLADTLRRFTRNKLAVVGLVIVTGLLLVAIFAEQLAPADPAIQRLEDKRMSPGTQYILGADEFGRDILSRIIFGARVALFVAVVAVAIALVFGVLLGLIAGYVGGLVDGMIMRAIDVLLAFPYLLLAIAVVSALGTGVQNTTLAVGIWATPGFARITRSQVLAIKNREYITAARALGVPGPRLVLRHILPNSIPPVIVFASLYMANAILLEAALSFLGLGVQPPQPSWGLMIANGRDFLRIAPHIATIPGLAIMLAVLGFNLLGDGLRDALDPTLRGQI